MTEPFRDPIPRLTYIVRTFEGQEFHTEPAVPSVFEIAARNFVRTLRRNGWIDNLESKRILAEMTEHFTLRKELMRDLKAAEAAHASSSAAHTSKGPGRPRKLSPEEALRRRDAYQKEYRERQKEKGL